MEIEATITEIGTTPVAPPVQGVPRADEFGTRPATGRPHSISLFGTERDGSRDVASRGADLLLGVGIGVALMYYLGRNHGAERRDTLGASVGELALKFLTRGLRQS